MKIVFPSVLVMCGLVITISTAFAQNVRPLVAPREMQPSVSENPTVDVRSRVPVRLPQIAPLSEKKPAAFSRGDMKSPPQNTMSSTKKMLIDQHHPTAPSTDPDAVSENSVHGDPDFVIGN